MADPPGAEAPPPTEVLFKEARRRRRRRWSAGLAALLVLAVIGALVANGESGPKHPASAPPTETVAPVSSSAVLPTAPPCSAGQLRPSFGTSGGEASQTKYVFLLTNTGARCELGGYPILTGVKNGQTVPLAVKHGTYFGDLSKSPIGTGAAGQLWMSTATACTAFASPADRAANTYPEVVVTLPGEHGSLTLSGATLDVACGLSETQVGLPPSGSGSPQTVENLTVAMALPRNVPEKVSTGLLHYTIELFNGMTSPIPCDSPKTGSCPTRCPDYRVTLTELRAAAQNPTKVLVRRTAPLDCTADLPIVPGATKRASLSLRVPQVSSQTTIRFKWVIVEPGRVITALVGGVGTFGGTKELLQVAPSRR